MIRLALAAVLAVMPGLTLAQDGDAVIGTGAVLRALDKVNGRTEDLNLPTGQSDAMFGLVVDMVECRYPADNPTGDAFAYLVIRAQGREDIEFEGWMIASSPALNALDHSRYDVWVMRCMTS